MNMYPLYVDIVRKRKIIQTSSGNKQSRLEEKVNSLLTRTQSLEDENLRLKKEDGRAEGRKCFIVEKGDQPRLAAPPNDIVPRECSRKAGFSKRSCGKDD